ncbi:MAG: adenylosuccinate synthase, partial [Fidelibacterota bacterium]
ALIKEVDELAEMGSDIISKLFISESSHLILPYHIRLDEAREIARGKDSIGTTKNGIGPAYEDKIARRSIKVGDLLDESRFNDLLREVMDYHNFSLRHFYQAEAMDIPQVFEQTMALVERFKSSICDVTQRLQKYRLAGENVLFEGAQGALLDIDHGTYPFVTSSSTTSGGAATGTGIGPLYLDYVLGITKVYTTRVGSGPFPTELCDEIGSYLGTKGHEIGATTGRDRRCGWLDIVSLKRSNLNNSVSGLCMTKLDVLDELKTIKICTAYELDGRIIHEPPLQVKDYERCKPIYEELEGWQESTISVQQFEQLPINAQNYLKRIEQLIELPIDIVSTGPDREETIVLNDPLE